MKYEIELMGEAFDDDQPDEDKSSKYTIYKIIELPFVPCVGLAIDLGECFGVVIQDVIWNCERECFECSVTFGWDDDDNEVQTRSDLEKLGWT